MAAAAAAAWGSWAYSTAVWQSFDEYARDVDGTFDSLHALCYPQGDPADGTEIDREFDQLWGEVFDGREPALPPGSPAPAAAAEQPQAAAPVHLAVGPVEPAYLLYRRPGPGRPESWTFEGSVYQSNPKLLADPLRPVVPVEDIWARQLVAPPAPSLRGPAPPFLARTVRRGMRDEARRPAHLHESAATVIVGISSRHTHGAAAAAPVPVAPSTPVQVIKTKIRVLDHEFDDIDPDELRAAVAHIRRIKRSIPQAAIAKPPASEGAEGAEGGKRRRTDAAPIVADDLNSEDQKHARDLRRASPSRLQYFCPHPSCADQQGWVRRISLKRHYLRFHPEVPVTRESLDAGKKARLLEEHSSGDEEF